MLKNADWIAEAVNVDIMAWKETRRRFMTF